MKFYKFEKNITLFKPEFDRIINDICQDHIIERISMELEFIRFRIKYIIKNKLDISEFSQLKKDFLEKSTELRNTFGIFMNYFFSVIVGFKNFNNDCIEDILTDDIKIDGSFIKFKVNIFRRSKCRNNWKFFNWIK